MCCLYATIKYVVKQKNQGSNKKSTENEKKQNPKPKHQKNKKNKKGYNKCILGV